MLIAHQRRQFTTSSLLLVAALCLGVLVPTPTASAAGATLVQTINTGRGGTWGPKYSPDPSGISYWPAKNRLVIVDGEVEEMSIWAGANVFESSLTGVRGATYDTTSFTREPVGIDIDVAPNGHFWISDDGHKKVFDINLGSDAKFRTSDDTIRTISVAFNSDPEGLTLAVINGETQLFLVDGMGHKIWRCRFGANGRFDGGGDDLITSINVLPLGIKDPEGLDYDVGRGTLWVIDRSSKQLNEVTIAGVLRQTVNLRTLAGAVAPADVTVAPGSSGGKSLYIVDRGVDNNVNPNENDGKIYEIKIG
jgi:hypothetical protein